MAARQRPLLALRMAAPVEWALLLAEALLSAQFSPQATPGVSSTPCVVFMQFSSPRAPASPGACFCYQCTPLFKSANMLWNAPGSLTPCWR